MHDFGITLLLALTSAVQPSPAPMDACTKAIPESLVAQLHEGYPEFRPVRASDYSPESLAYPKAHGISCPGVAVVVINGVTHTALFVTAEKSGHTLLLEATQRHASVWSLTTLLDFGNDGVSRSYVEPIKAGRYVDLFASDHAPGDHVPEQGQVDRYLSRSPGFLAGTIESTGVAFFFTGKRWVHLWLED